MSILKSIPNIKVPYPTEGVIRTAQLDDTIAPTNSVQLAVNMNFDRVGAIQTRLGVTKYADDLVDSINSYGALRNSVIPAGFDFIFQLGSTQQLSNDSFSSPAAIKISDTKIAVFWRGPSGFGYCRNFSIDQATGTASPLGNITTFESTSNDYNNAVAMDADHVINVWRGTGGIALAAGFNVLGDTITVGTPYQFESSGLDFSLAAVDGTHAVVFFGVTSGHLFADILAIDLSTLAITEPGSTLDVTGTLVRGNSCAIVNGTHVLNAWEDSGSLFAQCFAINTGSWAITAVGSALSVASGTTSRLVPTGDNQHYVDFFKEAGVFIGGQTLSVNLSTFAVTSVGTPLSNSIIAVQDLVAARFTSAKMAIFYSTGAGTGFMRMVSIDGSFNLTFIANVLSGYDVGAARASTILTMSTTEVMTIWGDVSLDTGKAAFFKPYGTPVDGRFLYAGSNTSVFNKPFPHNIATPWTRRRTGLAVVSKPRFSQYLNYIWMVNGNAQIGGDPVATSNGGNFGTDLIPDNFPAGDFISAGFEGRVWVANKTTGVIYYTDIVQFIQPSTYILTYNQAVNFISQLTPQTGESITALYQVPRALLVFTENSIYRIYGATSVDAYPAYNVGTFSQESILETKTGIFFHHSSGFYQFDYGSQPVEISRRIIDFVKAIPRDNYGDITGAYDGFDCVQWSVGQVTVEGVVFTNCVLRYTISTQVWTIYDYVNDQITAMIFYDDGTDLVHLMGTSAGKTGAMETGFTDFGAPFYFEFIDRWRPFDQMYYLTKSMSGFSVYSENAAGANLSYQKQKSGPNAWLPIGTVDEENNAIMPNSNTDDFDVIRLRLAGNTKGAQIVVHGIEITQLTIKGQEIN